MSMFDNYKNIPDTYIPNNSSEKKLDNRLPKKPLGEYDLNGKLVGYSWLYGDGIILQFTTRGTASDDNHEVYMDAEDYIEGKYYKLDILDTKFNSVYSITQDAAPVTTFTISKKDSTLYLPRGVYTCKLTLIDENDETAVVFDYNNGKLFVK